MKPYTLFFVLLLYVLPTTTIMHCTEDTPLDDAQKIAALRKVTVTFDSTTYQFGLPQGALNGKTFDQLLDEDSATFANPANYKITILVNMTADNTKDGAQDAKFDGMTIDIIMDTMTSSPIHTVANAFEVKKNTTHPTEASGTINLATHRMPGLYIFRQTVDGDYLATTLSPSFNYTIGSQSGTIDLPDVQQNIPTRASSETKAFLKGLLDSGIFGSKRILNSRTSNKEC